MSRETLRPNLNQQRWWRLRKPYPYCYPDSKSYGNRDYVSAVTGRP